MLDRLRDREAEKGEGESTKGKKLSRAKKAPAVSPAKRLGKRSKTPEKEVEEESDEDDAGYDSGSEASAPSTSSGSSTKRARVSDGLGVQRRSRHSMKLRHRRPRAQSAPKRKVSKAMKKVSVTKKLLREGISDKDFLPGLSWESWKLAMVPNMKDRTDSGCHAVKAGEE